jgi:NADH-quinone oxidoreductase subunit G
MIRKNGELVEASWDEAIAFVADGLNKHAGDELGALVAPLTSNEEGWLLANILRGLNSDSIDHRLRTIDFSDGAPAAAFEMPLAQVAKAKTILLVGSNPRHEAPLLSHRIREAWKHGAKVFAVNPLDFDFNFVLAGRTIATPAGMVDALLRLARAGNDDGHLPDSDALAGLIKGVAADDAASNLHATLKQGGAVVIFGDSAVQHPQASILRAAARFVATTTAAAFNEMPAGANAIGLARAGVVPQSGGRDAAAMLTRPGKALVAYHLGSQDTSSSAAYDAARSNAEFHVYIGAYACNGVKRTAHAVLPVGLPPEIDGTYVNVDGAVQATVAGAKLPGEARPGWRVLRALGAKLGLEGFAFTELAELRAAMQAQSVDKSTMRQSGRLSSAPAAGTGLARIATVPIYRSDAVVRRARALQDHPLTGNAAIALNPEDALAAGLAHGAKARIGDGAEAVELPVIVSRAVPRGAAWVESTWPETRALPPTGAALTIARA